MEAESQAEDSVVLGKYRLLLELGQGGTANVYLGALSGPSGFSKLVVLKVLKSELANENEFRQMFLDEARLAARLNHPNVVQTNEVFEIGVRPVIVMEYLEGQAFSAILARGRNKGQVPLNVQLKIISEVLSGLHYAHELTDYDGSRFELVHRDMTPHNVFVAYDGRVCVLDFGIAKLQGSSVETRTGVIKGKLRYMPPEQILGESLDRRADLFSVGVMLWEAATQMKIWNGLTDASIMYNVVNNLIPSPKTVRPEVSDELERICMKALAFNKDQRYATAAELQADVDALLETDSISMRAIGKFASSLFQDTRAITKELIERKLTNVKWNTPSGSIEEWAVTSGAVSHGGFSPSSNSSPPTMTGVAAPRRRPMRAAIPLVLLALLGVGYFVRTKRDHQPAAEQTVLPTASTPLAFQGAPPASALAAPKQETGPARHVRLKINASPDTAQLYIDDRQLDSNPYSGMVAHDSAMHTIRAVAQGFETETKLVTFEDDLDVTLSLSRPKSKTTHAPPPSPPRTTASRDSRPPAPTPTPTVNCNPPFTFDPNGIRRLKPECL